MKFETYTLEDVYNVLGIKLSHGMTFEQVGYILDSEGISYFYVSMAKEDIIEAINNEPEIAKALGLTNVFIKDLCIYISIY